MTWYSVRVQALAPAGAPHPVTGERAADALMTLLEQHDGVVSSGAASWDATVSVQAASARDAVSFGAGLIGELARQAGMPAWPLARAEAVRQDVLDEEVHSPLRRPVLGWLQALGSHPQSPSHAEFCALLAIALRLDWRTGEGTAAESQIAEDAKVSERRVRSATRWARDAGLLEQTQRGTRNVQSRWKLLPASADSNGLADRA